MTEFEELVGIAIGEASMCWSETPKGVFESTRASGIVDRIMGALRKERDTLQAENEGLESSVKESAARCLSALEDQERYRRAYDKWHAEFQAQLSESTRLNETYKTALDKVLIKVDWNSDEFHNVKQYNETREIILNALVVKRCKDL